VVIDDRYSALVPGQACLARGWVGFCHA
jgi:hypothetical protein